MAAHGRFMEAIEAEGGAVLDGAELQPTGTARSLRWTGERVDVVDGPYAETVEQLGGLYLIDAPDLDQAIAWSRLLPHSVEIRPVAVQEDPMPEDPAPAVDDPQADARQPQTEGVHALAHSSTATCLRRDGDEVQMTDGPLHRIRRTAVGLVRPARPRHADAGTAAAGAAWRHHGDPPVHRLR